MANPKSVSWRKIHDEFSKIETEGRPAGAIFKDMEADRDRLLREHEGWYGAASIIPLLFRKFSNPYNPEFHHVPPRDDIGDGSYTRICDIGTRI